MGGSVPKGEFLDILPAHAPNQMVLIVDGIQELNRAGPLVLFKLLKD